MQETQSGFEVGMSVEAWREMVSGYREPHQHIVYVHLLDLCAPGNEYLVDESTIEMLREPERTQCMRWHLGKWPFGPDEIKAMPGPVQMVHRLCYENWKAKRSGSGMPVMRGIIKQISTEMRPTTSDSLAQGRLDAWAAKHGLPEAEE